MPAVVVVIAATVAAIGICAHSIRLADAAGAVARAAGRGDTAGVARLASSLAPGASLTMTGDPSTSEVVCVRLDDSAVVAGLPASVRLTARGCAPGAGR